MSERQNVLVTYLFNDFSLFTALHYFEFLALLCFHYEGIVAHVIVAPNDAPANALDFFNGRKGQAGGVKGVEDGESFHEHGV